LIHPEDAPQTMLQIKTKLARMKVFHLIFRIIRKRPKIIWVEEFADVIIKNGKNSIEGIMIDITQKRG
jgi:PAS domain S-box-containing protein